MTTTQNAISNADSPERANRRLWLGLGLLMLPTMAIGLDVTVLHLAAPEISAQLHASTTQLLWITDIYGFMIAGLLITMGTFGDRIGRRRLLMTGAAAFAVASILAAYAPSAEMLIASRALLGVTGASLMPSTLSLISNMFTDARQRGLAIAIWTMSFILAGAIGPVIGGFLLAHAWWGSVFLVAVPAMALLLAFGRTVLPEYRNPEPGRMDPASVLLSLIAILSLIYGLKELAKVGAAMVPLAAVILGLAVGLAFVRRQRQLRDPLLDLTLLARPTFSVALGAQLMALLVMAGTQFLLLQYLQQVAGMSAIRAGMLIVPSALLPIGTNLLTPLLARRFGHAHVLAGALLASAVGLVVVAQAGADSGWLIGVLGFTLISMAANPATVLTYDLIIGNAPPERAGSASGMGETATELGISLGVALSGTIAAATYQSQLATGLPNDLSDKQRERAGDALPKAVQIASDLPPQLGTEVTDLARTAFTNGVQLASLVSAGLTAIVAALVVILLRAKRADNEPSSAVEAGDSSDALSTGVLNDQAANGSEREHAIPSAGSRLAWRCRRCRGTITR